MADASKNPVPLIDMQDFPGQLKELIRACQEWGCFRIVNFGHILSKSLMLEMKAVVRSLLELPMEIKKRNVDVIAGSGYMAPSQINPLYEALWLYDMASPEDVNAFCSNLDASPHQRVTILKYAKAVNELMMEIRCKIGEGLGDDEIVGGLEVIKRCGTFEAVDPYPGSLLVNVGDIATVWSNGRFLNVKHRVMCKEAAVRVSIASFLLGPKDLMVETPEELVDSEHPRLYVPLKYQYYRDFRVSKKLHTGAIDHFRH